MNLQQLEYILAVEANQHFAKAAESCFVTQATLSMMIKKLEEELGIVIFDRSKQPVVATDAGKEVLAQARNVIAESKKLKQLSMELKSEIRGELRLGIIPTVAPYVLPLFLAQFIKKYPAVHLVIKELTTDEIVYDLQQDRLDVGLLATPLPYKGLQEWDLFDEPLQVFVSGSEKSLKKKYVMPEHLDPKRLWLLEEGHCLRSQILQVCELKKKEEFDTSLTYEAGSIESLINIVEANEGITIVPQLATLRFNELRMNQLRNFKSPVPVRRISLITYRHFAKRKLLQALQEEITRRVDPHLMKFKEQEVVGVA